MPSRSFCLVVATCWLGVTAWLIYTEVLPHLIPGTPPPFSIDRVEEAQHRITTRWIAMRGEERVFIVETTVQRLDDGLFEMKAEYKPAISVEGKAKRIEVWGVEVKKLSSAYRVTAEGDLKGLSVDVEGAKSVLGVKVPFEAHVEGNVSRGRIAPYVSMKAAGVNSDFTMLATDVPRGGAILMPLHPVNRIRGLYCGQQWTMQAFDPFAGVLQAVQKPSVIRAAVRPKLEVFSNGRRRKSEPCYVIDYTGDGLTGSTWVSARTWLVVMQEATQDRESWSLYRD